MNIFKTIDLNKKKKDNRIFSTAFITIILILSIIVDPRDISFLSCQFLKSTGNACPTCGMSRSFYAIAHLDFAEAFNYHFLGPFLYLFLLIVLIKFSLEVIIKKEIKILLNPIIPKLLIIFFAVLWMSLWISIFF